jgi:hypothetical protein
VSAKDGKVIYFGRGGKAHGPFPAEKLEQLRLTGEIDQYTYLWDEASRQWRNLDPMPPALGSAPAKKRAGTSLEMTEAVCHDHCSMVTGTLENLTDAGCELVSHEHTVTPKLALHSPLVLNVTDPAGEQAMSVKASLSSVSRRDGAWVYCIRWAQLPSF